MLTFAENILGVVLSEKLEVGAVFFTVGFFLHAIEQAGGGEGDRNAIDLADDLVFRGFLVTDAAGGGHEVHADFIADTDDGVFGSLPVQLPGERGQILLPRGARC